jgi:hypothetical protein
VKGLHFALAGGSLTAFGGQLPRLLQGAAMPRHKSFLERAAFRQRIFENAAIVLDLILDIEG